MLVAVYAAADLDPASQDDDLVPPEVVEAQPPVLAEEVLPSAVTYVVAIASVDADGAVTATQIETSGGEALDAAVMRALATWRFTPARRNGLPIPSTVRVPFTFAPNDAAAETPTPPPPPVAPEPEAPASPTYETVVSTRGHRAMVSVSDFGVELGELKRIPRRSATSYLTLVPSVMLTNHGGEGHADSVFLRGIAAGEGKDIAMSVQGVPLNEVANAHGHGYADTYFIIPELVSRLRVVEGPFDPAQGDFAVAGSASFELGVERRGVSVSGSVGNFGSKRLSGVWGPGASSDTFVGMLVRRGDGFGPNRAYSNVSAMAQHKLVLDQATTLTLFAASYAGRFSSAGVLRDPDLRRGDIDCGNSEPFFCSYDRNQGGAIQRHIGSVSLAWRGEDGSSAEQNVYAHLRTQRMRENFTGFLNDVPPLGETQRGDLNEQSYGGITIGAAGHYRARARMVDIELGYFTRYDDVNTRSRRLRASNGAPYAQLFDNDVRSTNVAGYVTARGRWAWLTARVGLRLESFFFTVRDRNRSTVDREGTRLSDDSIDAYGQTVNPRASLEAKLNSTSSLFASFGMGARSSDAAALSNGELAPFARIVAADFGARDVRAIADTQIDSRAGVFATRVSRDLVFDEVAGRNQPIGASNRSGAFTSVRVTHGSHLDLLASASYTRAYQPAPGTSVWRIFDGPELPYAPRGLVRFDGWVGDEGTLFGHASTYGFALGVGVIGPRPLPLGTSSQAIVLVDTSLNFGVGPLEITASVTNLFDRRWRESEFNYASNFREAGAEPSLVAVRHFSAGAPRMVLFTTALHWDAP